MDENLTVVIAIATWAAVWAWSEWLDSRPRTCTCKEADQ